MNTTTRSRWAAIGAAVAVTLGAGGIGISHATSDSGDGAVAAFFPIEPCRLAANVAIAEDDSITLNGWGTTGACTLPNDISGLTANVTAVNATSQTNLRFYAQGGTVPETANLNPTPGAPPTPNAVNITLNDTNGQFQVYNRFGSVGVYIDVMGYYDNHTHDDRYLHKSQDSEAALFSEDSTTAVTATDVVLATATVDTPTSGYVIANSSIQLYANGTVSGARCSITTGTTLDTAAEQVGSAGTNLSNMIAGTRGFTINKALTLITPSDEMTVNLVCDGVGGAPELRDPQLTLVFIPDPDAFGFIFVL